MRVLNPYCFRCGDTRGGPYGHESNECTWNRQAEEAHRALFRYQPQEK